MLHIAIMEALCMVVVVSPRIHDALY